MRRRDHRTHVCTLANGLRMGYRHVPQAPVEYCGVVVHVGSRDDAHDALGMAHFVEHTIFKGTARRKSWHIINRMERVGGELNAYTTKEETVVYTAAPAGNLRRAMELIADLVMNSRFPQPELDKEREVVADEINSYLDSPADAVFDDFEEQIFAGTPLAHNILGTIHDLERFDSTMCQQYLSKWYVATNMTVFYSGSATPERVRTVIEECFGALPAGDVALCRKPSALTPSAFELQRDISAHQAHTVMGQVIGGMYSPDKYAMSLLTNMLGGPGMNSLLNMALRERKGLVYSVEASTTLFPDCGLFTVYFGCDRADVPTCVDLARKQIMQLAEHPVGPAALARAKKQYLGQMAVARDNHENVAISLGRSAMYFGDVLTAQEISERVNSVNSNDLAVCAEALANLSILTLY